jgi:hypothetical protein
MKYILLLCTLVSSFLLHAQSSVKTIHDTIIDDFELVKSQRLLRIQGQMLDLEEKIKKNLIIKRDKVDIIARLKLDKELDSLQLDYTQKKLLLVETLTGLSLVQQVSEENKSPKSLLGEVQEIVEPVLSSFKSLSSKPRQIQRLKEEQEELRQKVNHFQLAINTVNKNPNQNELKQSVNVALKYLEQILADYKIKLEDTQFRLLKLQAEEGTFVTSLSKIVFDFFKNRGKNLFFAIAAFIINMWFFTYIRDSFMLLIARMSGGFGAWYLRPIRVIYSIFVLLFSIMIATLILYVLNDWVLVTFIALTIGAIIWGSKQYFPVFYEQLKIALNLGNIRENEVVVYKNIPWKIVSLGIYCRLENPYLTGGLLRINSKELMQYHSRPIQKTEPWFPTKLHDWVILSDGTYGMISFQSPEQIVLKLIGGSVCHLKVDNFLMLRPVNLSQGHGIEQIVRLDHALINSVTSDVLVKLKEGIWTKLKIALQNDISFINELQVDFHHANTSSLDIRLFLICGGELAGQKCFLERLLQKSFVEVCNEESYVIPFNQMTVHMNYDHKQ